MSNKKVESAEQCPLCADDGFDTDEDNLVTFADSGVKHCHRHGFMGIDGKIIDKRNTNQKYEKVEHMSETGLILDGEYAELKSRGLTRAACEHAGYQIHKEKEVHIANYRDESGNIKMQQLRTLDKKFPIIGDKSYNKMLWGQNDYKPNKNLFVTIVEGQIDRVSILVVTDCKYAAVSVPNGTGNAAEILKLNTHWLLGFHHIVLGLDNDDPGRKATQECLALDCFPPGFIHVAKWTRKDPNEMLVAGEHRLIQKIMFDAVPYIPPSILTGQGLLDTLADYKTKTIDWPWESFNAKLNPIYVPGVYSIAGRPNVGKTALMAELIRAEISKGKKVGIISLEESVQKLLLKITSLITGIDLKNIRNRTLVESEIDQCREVANNIVTYDHKTYGTDLSTICDSLPYIAQALQCEMVIFDNLSYSATNASDDERRAIDKAMIRLQDTCVKYDFTLFNIAHLNSDDDTAKDATIRGSRGVQMYSSYVIHIDREIESDDPIIRNTLNFYVKKDRESGDDVGKHLQLRYNTHTRRLEDF